MPDVSLSSTARINDDAVFRELDGESIVLNLQTGTYFGLDEVGTRVWQLIEQYGALHAVRDALVAEFEVEPETAGRDLAQLVSDLADRGLVDLDA